MTPIVVRKSFNLEIFNGTSGSADAQCTLKYHRKQQKKQNVDKFEFRNVEKLTEEMRNITKTSREKK